MADCDSDNNSESLLPPESQDFFQESQDFFQESQDFFSDDSLLPLTNIIIEDPLKKESSPKISLTCEEYLKDFTTDESTIDSDPTPDVEFTTTFRKCDKFEHSLTADVDSADKSDHTHTTDVDSIKCNVLGCNYSHTCACEQKLIEEYNISPVIVKRWMDLL